MTTRRTHAQAETDRGARIIQRATELLNAKQARGWSHALELARREANR